jgi:oligopeptidase B
VNLSKEWRLPPHGLGAGLLCVSVMMGCSSDSLESNAAAPVAETRPHDVTSANGTRRDEYYWLRDDTRADKAMLRHLQAENDYADTVLAPTRELQERLYQEIVGRLKQDDASVPYRMRGFFYYTRYEIGREHPIHARRQGSLSAPEQVMLDVNQMASGLPFFQLGNWAVSPDNRLLAWTEDSVGRRQYTLRFKELGTGRSLPDAIENVEAGVAWSGDSGSVLYVAKDPVTLLGDTVRRHVLGTANAADALIHHEEDKSFYTSVGTTKDERFLTIRSRSTVSDEVRVADAHDPSLSFSVLVPRERGHEYDAEHLDGRWIIRTNWRATNFRIVEAPGGEAGRRERWKDLVPHREDTLVEAFDVFDGFLVAQERADAVSRLRVQPWNGASFLVDSDEPAYTARLGDNRELDTHLLRYTYTSLTTPVSTYDLDTATRVRTLLKEEPVLGGFDRRNYATEQVWAGARDGVKVPVSLVYRRGFRRDGTAPLLQYGYGSYGYSMDPAFSLPIVSLLDRGFVYAIAHIRGGQELGRRWYEDGKLQKKRNTFTDFIDVTRHLVAAKYADPSRVFATGGSAGGLLMGAVANMAPREYRGIVASVPFVDVVTTMLDETIPLTTNEFDEWGNPKDKAFYDYMLAYSPYDNVSAQAYPAMFVATGLWDSQVQYYEPAKWVARLRARNTGTSPLVFRINMDAGHGGKSGRFRRYREIAEQYAFLLWQAGAE